MRPVRSPRRELWLARAVEELRPILAPDALPPIVVRTDLKIVGPTGPANGCCWDDAPECRIDIAAELDDRAEILAVLLHELVHAAVGPDLGHNGAFRPLFVRVGFVGMPTGYEASQELQKRLQEVARRLGPYPKA